MPAMGTTGAAGRSPVLVASAGGAAALMAITGVVVRDIEAVAIGVGLVVAVALLWWRRGLLGRIALLGLLADVVFWMAPAAWSNATNSASLGGLLVPLVLVVLSVAGLASVVGVPDRPVAFARAALLAAALVFGVVQAGGDRVTPGPGAVVVSSRGAKFSSARLEAAGPEVTVVYRNHDLFWHTFTIDALDVDIRAPLSATRSATFRAEPGTYRFYCAIPGHESAGMKGTLTVRTV